MIFQYVAVLYSSETAEAIYQTRFWVWKLKKTPAIFIPDSISHLEVFSLWLLDVGH